MHGLFESNAQLLIRRLLNQNEVMLATELLAWCTCSADLRLEVRQHILVHKHSFTNITFS